MRRRTLFVILATVALAVAVELGLQIRSQVRTGASELTALFGEPTSWRDPVTGLTLLRPGAVLTGSAVRTETNSWGLRSAELAPEPRAGETRVALLGASTLQDPYARSNDDTVAGRLQRLIHARGRADVVLINAGVAGLALDEQVRLLAARLIPAGVRTVVWYPGTNDIGCRSSGSEPDHGASPAFGASLPRWVLTRDLIVKNTLFLRPEPPASGRAMIPATDFAQIRAALEAGVRLARRHGVRVILATPARSFVATQPAELRRRLASSALHATPCYATDALIAEKERFNELLRSVAAELRVPLIDASAELSGRPELFRDSTHLSDAGAERLAVRFGERLLQDLGPSR